MQNYLPPPPPPPLLHPRNTTTVTTNTQNNTNTTYPPPRSPPPPSASPSPSFADFQHPPVTYKILYTNNFYLNSSRYAKIPGG